MRLYAISDGTYIKLGYSVDPESRVVELQTGSSSPLRVTHSVEIAEHRAHLVEQRLHRELSHLRVRGEWFRLSESQARAELEHAVIRWGEDPLL